MPTPSNSVFHSEQLDPGFAGYRPVSKLAVAALMAGLAAASALAHPLLWCVPLVGVVLAVTALVRLDRPDVSMVGRKAAIVGLALSILFGVAAPVHAATVNYWLLARAQRLADEWFARIQSGRTQEAYDLMVRGSGRPPPVAPHSDTPAAAPKTDLELFAERPAVARLLKLGARAQPKFLAGDVVPDAGDRGAVALLYRVYDQGDSTVAPFTVQFNLQQRVELGGERWLISSVVGSR